MTKVLERDGFRVHAISTTPGESVKWRATCECPRGNTVAIDGLDYVTASVRHGMVVEQQTDTVWHARVAEPTEPKRPKSPKRVDPMARPVAMEVAWVAWSKCTASQRVLDCIAFLKAWAIASPAECTELLRRKEDLESELTGVPAIAWEASSAGLRLVHVLRHLQGWQVISPQEAEQFVNRVKAREKGGAE